MSRPVKLITKDLEKRLPGIGRTSSIPLKNKILHIRYTINDCHFYAVEYDETRKTFHGIKYEAGIGTIEDWSLLDLESHEDYFGIRAERDVDFKPVKTNELFVINTDDNTFRLKI